MSLDLVPCEGCGSTSFAAHQPGASKCCPDCEHNLVSHDRDVVLATVTARWLLKITDELAAKRKTL